MVSTIVWFPAPDVRFTTYESRLRFSVSPGLGWSKPSCEARGRADRQVPKSGGHFFCSFFDGWFWGFDDRFWEFDDWFWGFGSWFWDFDDWLQTLDWFGNLDNRLRSFDGRF